ncbi:nitroreductase family protein [Halothermothrix orenii]|uniref:Nitroreductase n=1 Tax=Halothermothrix orenii (strain H 168 / OCM 544 / DSM 9562) TaxID=373903 RepID=B8CXQ3_HALOH|nr:nitroreductase family protein [Halothermothrix orenii]ACL70072.1 nitroreductase [Halothermothrix orenii H 168]
MSGIVFFKTTRLEEIKKFYQDRIGMDLWLDQGQCLIFEKGNLQLGFCKGDRADIEGIITFYFDSKSTVDEYYQRFEKEALDKPVINEKFNIYHFYIKDPEGRKVEFQTFLHDLNPYLTGVELLLTRRSIRKYRDREVPEEILWNVFERCRYAPTSRNSQSYYFVVVKDRNKLEYLASLRGSNSRPIATAPMAVAICSDSKKSKRFIQDGCIAAYHFLLAARLFGLGTCWIAAMDRKEVKKVLDIPRDHYVATVTPLGYPAEKPNIPPRKKVQEMVRFV